MRAILVLAALVLVWGACGSDGGPETAEEAAVRQYEMYGNEQFGRFYDELHPDAQEAQSRDEYIRETGSAPFPIRSVRAVESHDGGFEFPDGTRTVTAVTLEFTMTMPNSSGYAENQMLTVYEELIDGKWRLVRN